MSERTSGTGAIRFGIGAAFRNLGAVTWRYLASVFSVLPIAVVVAFVVDQQFASSLAAETFALRMDPILALELAQDKTDAIVAIAPLFAGAAIMWIALSAFMTAAVIGAVGADHPLRTNELFAAGGRGFGRLMRLFPFGLVTTVVAAGLPAVGVFKLQSKITEDWISEPGVFATRVVALGISLLALSWANGAYDLMKVEAVAKGDHRARWAFVRGLWRGVRHPFRLLRVYLPFVLFSVLLTIGGSLLDVRIARDAWSAVIVGFLLQQVIAFGRAWSSVALAGAEVALTRRES